ncbi:hypothetical protein GGU10DRAFT_407004 [Lentinula aff. detonsa]|uniref:Dolichyl-phosphate-mannose--protein mannosyltransferase n=1 Tax=Lentinula aff. detonsa TaxID=2804958 RepID=A0AA38NQE6_9AGAR|nr:hypothetical protein GGU10DRAFT_407004 [Lentinula aff. detonsa]
MRIKLLHISTEKMLHSHDIRPPVFEVDFPNEVLAYGAPGFQGDANDDWILEVDEAASREAVKLPEWGFEQQEVTCNENAVRANSLWFVETAMYPDHEYKFLANAPKVNYRLPGFLAKFLKLQQVMWTTNAGLTDRHLFDSRPDAWPRLRRGIEGEYTRSGGLKILPGKCASEIVTALGCLKSGSVHFGLHSLILPKSLCIWNLRPSVPLGCVICTCSCGRIHLEKFIFWGSSEIIFYQKIAPILLKGREEEEEASVAQG